MEIKDIIKLSEISTIAFERLNTEAAKIAEIIKARFLYGKTVIHSNWKAKRREIYLRKYRARGLRMQKGR